MRGPQEAAKRIGEVVGVTDAPRPTRSVLFEIISISGLFSRDDAEEKADAWLDRFMSRLALELENSAKSGSVVTFSFNSSGTDFVQGACFAEPAYPADVRSALLNRSNLIEILSQFSALSSKDFEILSGRVLSLLGVDEVHVTQSSADQGVDFFGRLALGELVKPTRLTPGGEKQLHVWLVGQSKHYQETKIGTGEIRELVGSIELARAKIFAGTKDPRHKLTARLCDPIVYLMFTTGNFTTDSRSLLSKSGVLSFDGMQISQLLADSEVGLVDGMFDPRLFRQWLDG